MKVIKLANIELDHRLTKMQTKLVPKQHKIEKNPKKSFRVDNELFGFNKRKMSRNDERGKNITGEAKEVALRQKTKKH